MSKLKSITLQHHAVAEDWAEAMAVAEKIDRGETLPEITGPSITFVGELDWRRVLIEVAHLLEAIYGEVVMQPEDYAFDTLRLVHEADQEMWDALSEQAADASLPKERPPRLTIAIEHPDDWQTLVMGLNDWAMQTLYHPLVDLEGWDATEDWDGDHQTTD